MMKRTSVLILTTFLASLLGGVGHAGAQEKVKRDHSNDRSCAGGEGIVLEPGVYAMFESPGGRRGIEGQTATVAHAGGGQRGKAIEVDMLGRSLALKESVNKDGDEGYSGVIDTEEGPMEIFLNPVSDETFVATVHLVSADGSGDVMWGYTMSRGVLDGSEDWLAGC